MKLISTKHNVLIIYEHEHENNVSMLKIVTRYYKRDFDHMQPVKFYTKASTRHIMRNHFFPQYIAILSTRSNARDYGNPK